MEKEEKPKPIQLSWHEPVLGGDCPHCEEWADFQEQNKGDEGWDFNPCESHSKEESGFGTRWAKIYICPNCKKNVEVEEVSW